MTNVQFAAKAIKANKAAKAAKRTKRSQPVNLFTSVYEVNRYKNLTLAAIAQSRMNALKAALDS